MPKKLKKVAIDVKATYVSEGNQTPKLKNPPKEKLSISKKILKKETKLLTGVKKNQRLKERKKKFLESIDRID